MTTTELHTLRDAVAATSQQLAARKLVLGTAGNVSARSGDIVAVTATGTTLATRQPPT